MKRTVSSPLTVVFKFIFPSLWIGMFLLGTVWSFSDGDNSAWHYLVALCLGATAFGFFCFPLKIVHIVPGSIVVSNFVKAIQVPFSQISDVTEWRWISGRLIWVHFKEATTFGRKIVFMPTSRRRPFKRHPIVGELKRLAQEHDSNISQVPFAMKVKSKRFLVLAGAALLLILAVVVGGIYLWLFAGVNPGASFIEELRNGAITESDIESIKILKFDSGGGWPFSEKAYDRKARQLVSSPETVKELITILKDSSTDGRQHRNHPGSWYDGILRVELVEDDHYYVFYHLGHYQGQYYVYVNANSKNSTNPNGAEQYENIPLADFLRRHDPWYIDADTPRTLHRPNFPDNIP